MLAVKQAHFFNKIRLGLPSKLINSQRSRFIMASTQNEVKLNDSLIAIDTDAYDGQLHAKQEMLEAKFAEFQPPKLEVFRSKPKHYRMRAEFSVWHEGSDTFYIMYKKDESSDKPLKIRVDTFPVASELLNELMTRVMDAVRSSDMLRRKLFQANFHTTLAGQSMVTLIYHKKLEEEAWTGAANILRESLAAAPGATCLPHVIGRSRKQRICLDAGEVEEVLDIPIRGQLRYIQVEGAFSQPNAGTSTSMLGWAVAATMGCQDHDLLELYCGNGNFTAAVAPNFRQVVATEVSKSAVAAARRNFEANSVKNVFVARMSSEEFVEAWHSGRKYIRLEGMDLKSCDFKTLLVDPPRAGLDERTQSLLKIFERVVYVSCNPATLHRDVAAVADYFTVEKFAMFDQFPYTHHVEVGVYLKRKEGAGKGADEERGVKRKIENEDTAAGAETKAPVEGEEA